ncbi:cyclic dof factor 3-like [Pyrus ussuriensis x Pyrus communis]|uniref:Cyclic dof factor 3-like n=1 Tax=Pyrus ussuriensis x Pyrus communis TaxID=2448454 RepID=A0A5N5FAE3_9ROSA|nr:cyclic dof factor 3-like [Pyrus ussuriensis x Pyrus communis]
MNIQCDVCNKDDASVFCTADGAALCNACDHRVHHANKLASKRLPSAVATPTRACSSERLGFSDSAAAHSLFHPSSMPRHFPTASHFRHMTISEAFEAARIDAPNEVHHPALKSNGKVLSFGVDAPICDSMASSLNPADKRVLNGTRNGLHKSEEQNVNGFSSQIPCLPGVPWPCPWNAAIPPFQA